jgi:hypothetical protein
MMHRFSAQMCGTPDRWLLHYGTHPAGELFWIVVLDHPAFTADRVCEGLNGVHGHQPARRWTATESAPGRWDLLDDGTLVGELAWTQPRMLAKPTGQWTQRALDGLNAEPAVVAFATIEQAVS